MEAARRMSPSRSTTDPGATKVYGTPHVVRAASRFVPPDPASSAAAALIIRTLHNTCPKAMNTLRRLRRSWNAAALIEPQRPACRVERQPLRWKDSEAG